MVKCACHSSAEVHPVVQSYKKQIEIENCIGMDSKTCNSHSSFDMTLKSRNEMRIYCKSNTDYMLPSNKV